jgi:hypothetical protein
MNETERNLHIMALANTDRCIPLKDAQEIDRLIKKIHEVEIGPSFGGKTHQLRMLNAALREAWR